MTAADVPLWQEPEPEPPAPLLGRSLADYLADPRTCDECGQPSGRATRCRACVTLTAARGAALVGAVVATNRTRRETTP